jgi:hypothetical protein
MRAFPGWLSEEKELDLEKSCPLGFPGNDLRR